jgi:microcystin degradation protein MlrC
VAHPFRIIAGGISHETNSFTPLPTRYADFAVQRGSARYRDEHGALAPFDAIDLLPTFVASASPGGLVERAAYERLKAELLAEIAAALPADALLLDLHGAMDVEGIGDGETDLIGAVRALCGGDMLIGVSLDLHGNISPELVARADLLTAYRTAPHRDAPATRRRALGLLLGALQRGARPVTAMVKLPLLLPGEAAVTDGEPAHSLYAELDAYTHEPGILDASIMIGCAWTDSEYATVSALVVAEQEYAQAFAAANRLAERVWARRAEFGYSVESLPVPEAIAAACAMQRRPVYLTDSGDNVTAGAPGDSPQIAAHLVAAGAQQALVAGLSDAVAVAACAEAGPGATLKLALGATIDPRTGPPLVAEALVEQVHRAAGGQAEAAVVRIGGVRIVVTADRRAFVERAQMAACGVDPDEHEIVVVKQGYLFPDLLAHAGHAIMVLSAGATTLRLNTLPYRRLPRPIYPLEPDTIWQPLK